MSFYTTADGRIICDDCARLGADSTIKQHLSGCEYAPGGKWDVDNLAGDITRNKTVIAATKELALARFEDFIDNGGWLHLNVLLEGNRRLHVMAHVKEPTPWDEENEEETEREALAERSTRQGESQS